MVPGVGFKGVLNSAPIISIGESSKTLQTSHSTTYDTVGFEGVLNLAPIMPRDASLSDTVGSVTPQRYSDQSSPKFRIAGYTQRNIFPILLNQTEIRLYLPFSD